jgi:hypothetical protein
MLARTRLVKRQRLVRRLVSEFDRLEPLPRGVSSCPAGSGAVIVAIFRYASTPDDPVEINFNGCTTVRNAPHHHAFVPSLPLQRQLVGLTNCPYCWISVGSGSGQRNHAALPASAYALPGPSRRRS